MASVRASFQKILFLFLLENASTRSRSRRRAVSIQTFLLLLKHFNAFDLFGAGFTSLVPRSEYFTDQHLQFMMFMLIRRPKLLSRRFHRPRTKLNLELLVPVESGNRRKAPRSENHQQTRGPFLDSKPGCIVSYRCAMITVTQAPVVQRAYNSSQGINRNSAEKMDSNQCLLSSG